MSQTFCPIPWNFQAIRSNGDIRVCCQANISANRGVLRKENGQAYNAGVDSLEEARNSSLIKEIRRKMLRGEWNEECTRCKQEEEAGLNSRRIYESLQWDFNVEDAKRVTDHDGAIETQQAPVVYYDLRFGNLCNLGCRMCGPTDSSFWLEDWVKLTGRQSFQDTSGLVEIQEKAGRFSTQAYDWHQFEDFWHQLEANLEHTQHVYMAGGEPLLIKRHYDFLEKCTTNGYAQNIILEYNTNCTKLPKKVLDYWTQFKQVRIGASVDGFGAYAEYQRYPSKWSEVFENLKILNQQPDNILPWLAFTVTAYNIFHMADFMRWKLFESGLERINRTHRRPIITHHVAHHPRHLNVRVLPTALKEKARMSLLEFVEEIKSSDLDERIKKNAQEISESVIHYMFAESYHEGHWMEFCKYTRRLDEIRNQSLLVLDSDFASHFVE